MLLDQMMNFMEKFTKELQESDPAKRDHFIKSVVNLLDISTAALKESPEFRQGFSRIHGEFLKYPESRELIKNSIEAYQNYIK